MRKAVAVFYFGLVAFTEELTLQFFKPIELISIIRGHIENCNTPNEIWKISDGAGIL
ncbi:MAG: hypothetical protein UU10_C0053G0002 [Parcubacteria group bacterium GW2011_GWF1_40_6]|nr:MAG: hypothetical protein UU10_C0053G0002 [Parcubacteria group bacterium GW2011_GWF1_40_6]